MVENLEWRAARDLLLEAVSPLGEERLPLDRAAGRILAAPVTARRDVPPFDRSPYDGYAFRSGDTAGALPVTLRILEEIPAGSVSSAAVTSGYAVKVLTGAPIPPGADAVSKFEETDFTRETVTLRRAYRSGESVIRQGEDVRAGEELARAGQRLDAGLAGALAAQGLENVTVYRRPRVGILTTGSELTGVGDVLKPGKIPNANRYALGAALALAGAEPAFFGSPGDDVAVIAAALSAALRETDLVVVTGGVSVGDYDLTPAALLQAGGELMVQNLRMKPGGKCCFGRKGKKLVTCLSGNPASAMTCFYAVVLPVLRALGGCDRPVFPECPVRLGERYPKPSRLPRLLRGRMTVDQEGRLAFFPARQQGNGALHSLAGANALAEIPAGAGPLEAGCVLQACYLEG